MTECNLWREKYFKTKAREAASDAYWAARKRCSESEARKFAQDVYNAYLKGVLE